MQQNATLLQNCSSGSLRQRRRGSIKEIRVFDSEVDVIPKEYDPASACEIDSSNLFEENTAILCPVGSPIDNISHAQRGGNNTNNNNNNNNKTQRLNEKN